MLYLFKEVAQFYAWYAIISKEEDTTRHMLSAQAWTVAHAYPLNVATVVIPKKVESHNILTFKGRNVTNNKTKKIKTYIQKRTNKQKKKHKKNIQWNQTYNLCNLNSQQNQK